MEVGNFTTISYHVAQVNRDSISNEMQKMRQQLEYLQAELLYARKGGPSLNEMQVFDLDISVSVICNSNLIQEATPSNDMVTFLILSMLMVK